MELKNVSYSLRDRRILSGLNWRLEPGQHWGVLGNNGAGKSTFLRLVRGEIWPRAGHGSRLYCLNGRPEESPLAFRQASALVSSELLDRYQRRLWNLSALETVCSGLSESVYLHEDPGREAWRRAEQALARVGLAGKEREPLLRLSRGQIKLVLLARALVRRPRVLILDEACEDLDLAARAEIFQVLDSLAQNGVSLLYATHRREELIPALSHLLVLEGGRIARQGLREEILSGTVPAAGSLPPEARARTASRQGKSSGSMVTISQADVFRERRRVLRKIDWSIEPGQSWALLGPNGAGKT
ncbi:MAG: ATP-binding cassette domain-containing protein, partial [Pseudomonadota bacterium]